MQTHQLIAHPSHPPLEVSGIEARLRSDDPNWLRIRWRIDGVGALILPKIGTKARADGLWQTTCFELFVRPQDGGAYSEWNLSPSRRWNAYDFDSYREGMRERDVAREPDGQLHAGSSFVLFDAAIPRGALPRLPADVAITAVLEEEGGIKSYWSIVHPEGKPDFHHTACFAATIPATDAP
ncbi:hypothetical protein SAMN06297468_2685 [Altererythrobacter xiamenensis]|uniref:DOMON-like domain-containing protein n=1 Tax=Altererythrobacter xiamenensis TaxID=1316679 RepID=A0A1Y6FIE2_9SPHN|nr:DOMON-like domain-containing protein [Altererythrobacter xiamenensis]SMQ74467.1 hypothetical protein SAMN06297468_2685 [Altererythrobacter xiamenensis]